MTLRIGQGFDVHAFEQPASSPSETAILLGGVSIPYNRKIKAHSDGDVLIHALCDALLGALALGDIGQHFPDTDPQYAGADSRNMLKHIVAMISDHQYLVVNADITIIAQQPKMAPHVRAMRENLASDLITDITNISVKATTTEMLGFTGRSEGIACLATVLLQKNRLQE